MPACRAIFRFGERKPSFTIIPRMRLDACHVLPHPFDRCIFQSAGCLPRSPFDRCFFFFQSSGCLPRSPLTVARNYYYRLLSLCKTNLPPFVTLNASCSLLTVAFTIYDRQGSCFLQKRNKDSLTFRKKVVYWYVVDDFRHVGM